MVKVFISGSMKIKELDSNVLARLKKILDKQYCVIVGDADGVDSSVQEYLKNNNARSVIVYCTGNRPRNNLGNWDTKKIITDSKPGTREYYTAKDLEMANDCDYGLMVWDTKSTGTLSNAIELLMLHKKSLVYVNKEKIFAAISDVHDLEQLIGYMSQSSFKKADSKLKIQSSLDTLRNEQGQLFA